MPRNRIHIDENDGLYFVTPTVWNWYYLFDRHERCHILADSLKYLQHKKSLNIHAYVFMLNHMNMIVQAGDVAGALRDFKRHTTSKLKASILEHEPALIDIFTTPDKGFKIWKPDNQPKLVTNEKFYLQKLNYIHNNPVLKEYVDQPEHWKWSSANPNSEIETVARL